MLNELRSWLADLLRPAAAPAPAPAALPEPAKPKASKKDEDEDDERRDARLERRRREAEDQAKRAEDRATRAEAARKAAEERTRALDVELAQARERARSAEARAKKVTDERSTKGGRGKGKGAAPQASGRAIAGNGAGDEGIRVRELEARLADEERRAEGAERRLEEVEAKLQAEGRRADELRARLAQAESAKRSEPAAPPARPSTPRRDAMARSSLDVHFSPGDECLFAICRQIESAEATADVCVFTITDDRIAARLLDAHRRGVRVRIITDNDKAHDEGSDIHRLARAGIEVRVDQTPFHMHHKFAIFDERRMLTGSYNWTRGAARDNEENLIVSDDPRLLRAFGREFGSLWEKLAPR
jgi:hypothetical protein